MWAKVAEEMQVPWRAAEAMHWQIGESDMARRAGVVPFSLSGANVEPAPHPLHHRVSPSRGQHQHSQSQGNLPGGAPSPRYGRGGGPPPIGIPPPIHGSRTIAARRESGPPRPAGPDPGEYYSHGGPGLAPIQTSMQPGRGGGRGARGGR